MLFLVLMYRKLLLFLLGLMIYRFGELDWHTEESPETKEYVAERRGRKDCHLIGISVLNWLLPTWGSLFLENYPVQMIQPATYFFSPSGC